MQVVAEQLQNSCMRLDIHIHCLSVFYMVNLNLCTILPVLFHETVYLKISPISKSVKIWKPKFNMARGTESILFLTRTNLSIGKSAFRKENKSFGKQQSMF